MMSFLFLISPSCGVTGRRSVASLVVYYFCHCMSQHVCPGEIFILDSHLAFCSEKKLPFWISACSVLIVVPLL